MNTDSTRNYSFADKLLTHADHFLKLCFTQPPSKRPNPADEQAIENTPLNAKEKNISTQLLRVNHSGEVCAQALYEGQALTIASVQARNMLQKAAIEEQDHLAWCYQRLLELNASPSLLNPLWYMGSYTLGALLGLFADKYNLGFVQATEHQVERHIRDHLTLLPQNDKRSRVILNTMLQDEVHHGEQAINAGGKSLPGWVESWMYLASQPMRFLSRYI